MKADKPRKTSIGWIHHASAREVSPNRRRTSWTGTVDTAMPKSSQGWTECAYHTGGEAAFQAAAHSGRGASARRCQAPRTPRRSTRATARAGGRSSAKVPDDTMTHVKLGIQNTFQIVPFSLGRTAQS